MKNQTNTRVSPRKDGLRTLHSAFRTPHSALRTSGGFTLIELLVVISIIALLASLLVPVLSKVKVKAQVKKAQLEAVGIAQAIHTYEGEYSKFPVSSGAMNAASAVTAQAGGPEDFTYGTAGVICVGPGGTLGAGSGFKTPSGTAAITSPGTYQTNNSEVMSVLLDVEHWPASPGVATINLGHAKNPSKTHYLNATVATVTGSVPGPGIGPDGVYRDPWGNPYIITIDLNYDDKARDALYRLPMVSTDLSDPGTTPPRRGLNGLIAKMINGSPVYEANAPVMVWSAGPDRMIDPAKGATVGANKDNVLSWK
jgi:prepilin-type N-terminal cleavage/methylation domain-containing protein